MQVLGIHDKPWYQSSLKQHGKKDKKGEKISVFKGFPGYGIRI
jgi:hypothetical protein